ncbi:MAG: aminomethyl-transferring glycine dehydrogenase subunit GcvPB [Turneriella sp.]|nr:aminomethyl-transferring glycine dehydrogenase subunit GcvPB [Leptospiraceae bacterium]MCX7631793.1 aminomethyl-transferring glycine dehydrogenase subunit GcvPB [Turneriella sp.]
MKRHTTRQTVRKERLLCDYPEQERLAAQFAESKHPLLQNPRAPEQPFPHLSEVELVRHYHRLAKSNYSWDDGLYPLGSCTMKYNPLINEHVAADARLHGMHPMLPPEFLQPVLHIIWETEDMLRRLLDLPAVTVQPAAGAHGELIGVLMIRQYFLSRGEKRTTIIIPESAHGTNPASAAMAGFQTAKVRSRPDGLLDREELQKLLSPEVAALMLTNPNTLGIFETEIKEIKQELDRVGALLYIDGANLNALVGKISFSAMGADLTQLNLHKTFSTPHGGGGPGQGALGCSERMLPFLPLGQIRPRNPNDLSLGFEFYDPPQSIGRVKAYYGQFGNILRAWAFLKSWGSNIHRIAETAVLNANYLRQKLQGILTLAAPSPSMHEVVFSQDGLSKRGLTTANLAKALLDFGFYAPTVYFPLNVNGAIMIEPTETEPKEELDLFIEAICAICSEPEKYRAGAQETFVTQIDEVSAARNPQLSWLGS